MVLETVRPFEPIARALAREAIALSLRIDPMPLRAWYCGDDEEEEEEEKKREEEEDEEEEDEDEEWKVSRPEKGAVPPGGPRGVRAASLPPPASPRSRRRRWSGSARRAPCARSRSQPVRYPQYVAVGAVASCAPGRHNRSLSLRRRN